MAPLFALLALAYSKQKQEQEMRREAAAQMQKRKVQALGGNTMGIDAADFNRKMRDRSFIGPEELMQIFGTGGGGGGMPTAAMSQALDADLAPNATAYTLREPPRQKLQEPDLISEGTLPKWSRKVGLQDEDDPYSLQLRI